MQLIANGSQYGTSPPAPQTPVGTPGYINNQTPGAGVTPTVVDPDVNNALIAEMVNVVTGAGIALSPGTFTQVIQAVKRMGAGNLSSIAASGTLTVDEAGLVLVSAAGGAVALTLPAANGMNGLPTRFTFIRTDTTANTVTITAAGSDTIQPGGGTSVTLTAENDRAELVSNGSNGWVTPSVMRPILQYFYDVHGTYNLVVPPGYSQARLKCWGSGAGGGGSGATYGGAGGSGGNARETIVNGIGGATLAITVATGGTAGTSGGGNGGNGAASSVANGGTTLCLANGGLGGQGGTAGGSSPAGGAAPSTTGEVGTVSYVAPHAPGGNGASGGSSPGGGGGGAGGPNAGASTPGSPGGGGAGASSGTANAGTVGADGGVLVEFF